MTRWLSDDEQRNWRAWLNASLLLPDRLSRDLADKHGLTMADYEILVQLSEHPERRIRMSELAERTLSSRSRLSHQIDRMVDAGLVTREACSDDRRGSFAVLTDTGWETIVAAAPDHVTAVRDHLVDLLGPERFAELGDTCRMIVDDLVERSGARRIVE
jgi:DNA-binding MarR family transcriptional regulator